MPFTKPVEPPPAEEDLLFQRYAFDRDLGALPSYADRRGEPLRLSDNTLSTRTINRLRKREARIREALSRG